MPKQLGFPFRVISVDNRMGLIISEEDTLTFENRRRRFLLTQIPQRVVKFYGIETPAPGQSGFSQASFYLRDAIRGPSEAFLEREPNEPNKNDRGSEVRHIWVWNRLLSYELVYRGYARVTPEGERSKYGEFLKEAQASAQRAKVGIWSLPSEAKSDEKVNSLSSHPPTP